MSVICRPQYCKSQNRKAAAATCAVRAELAGDICSALGVEARSSSPILALCRSLVEAGRDPATPLHVFRDNTLALKVRSIGEGAKLTVEDSHLGKLVFRPRRNRPQSDGAGPPIALMTLGIDSMPSTRRDESWRQTVADANNPELRRCGGKSARRASP